MKQYMRGDEIGGEYTVLDVFGGERKSGMGVVYLVDNREAPEPFVLKTYQQLTDENVQSQFLAEARAWISAGAHAHIVQAFWVREIAGQIYIAAEFIEPDDAGRNNLTQFLDSGRLPTEVILIWAAQFCHGMDYARSKGVMAHRDIKPDNLMIGRDGSLKITDFGLAKSIAVDYASNDTGKDDKALLKTRTGAAMGTLPYMAPEQFRDAKSADHRADIYSFGVILYEMVTGSGYPYFIARDSQDLGREYYQAHSLQKPMVIDSPLMPVISKCLQKEPELRYQSYDALLSDVHKIAHRLGLRIPLAEHVSKDDEELYAQAQSYIALGDKDRALQAINEYVQKYPGNYCGWTEKGRIHMERGERQEALAATKRSLHENPYNTHAWNNLGCLLSGSDSPFEEVRAAFSNALRLDGLNTAAMMNFVAPLIFNKEYSEAANLTAKAIKIAPRKPLLVAKAQDVLSELVKIRDLPSAVLLLESWTESRPDDVDAWHNLGLFYIEQNKSEAAISCFENAQRLAPEDSFSIVQLTKLYFSTNNGNKCLQCCEELLARGIEPMLAISTKARVVNFLGGYQQALNLLKGYLDQNPDNDGLWVLLADVHEFQENYQSAERALNKAKSILLRASGPNVASNLQFVDEKLEQLSRKESY